MKSEAAGPIFDKDVGESGNRRQLNIYEKGFQNSEYPAYNLQFLETIHHEVISLDPGDPELMKYYPSLLYSPGVNDFIQPPHHDLKSHYRGKAHLLLVALMDRTTLMVLHRSHREPRPVEPKQIIPTRIELSRGDCIMFHPALIHCGDAFKSENLRLHYYVLPNRARLADFTVYPSEEIMERCDNPISKRLIQTNVTKSNKRQKALKRTAYRKLSMASARLHNSKVRFPEESKEVPDQTSDKDGDTPIILEAAEEKTEPGIEDLLAAVKPSGPRFRRYIHRAFNNYMQEHGLLLRIFNDRVGYIVPP